MVFSTPDMSVLFQTLFPHVPMAVADVISTPTAIPDLHRVSVLEVTYNSISHAIFTQWLRKIANFLSVIADTREVFSFRIIWTRANYLPLLVWVNFHATLTKALQTPWFSQRHHSLSIEYGDVIDADIVFIIIYRNTTITSNKISDAHTVIFVPSTHNAIAAHTPPPSSASVISISTSALAISYTTIDRKPRVIAAIIPSSQLIQKSHAPNYILDSSFPMMEPSPACYASEYFGWRAGLCCGNTGSDTFIGRSVSNIELLLCYSIPLDLIPPTLDNKTYKLMVDCCSPHSIPWQSKLAFTTACVHWCGIMDLHFLSSGEHTDNFQCYFTRTHKDTLDWTNEYSLDKSTVAMLSFLKNQPSSSQATVPASPSVLQDTTPSLNTDPIFSSTNLKYI